MPTQLGGVGVMVNGRPAYVYYVSLNQINALTPLDDTSGPAGFAIESHITGRDNCRHRRTMGWAGTWSTTHEKMDRQGEYGSTIYRSQ